MGCLCLCPGKESSDNKMEKLNVQPWPSTYVQGEVVSPSKLVPNSDKREVGAFKCTIPLRTVEPPQIHLIAPMDDKPFQELLTGFDKSFFVAYFNPKTNTYMAREYSPGQDIVIPKFRIHWLMNLHDEGLGFTCEYAPHPWEGDIDEPKFPNLTTLLRTMGRDFGPNFEYAPHPRWNGESKFFSLTALLEFVDKR